MNTVKFNVLRPCDRTLTIQLNAWAAPASVSISSGILPSGLSYTAVRIPDQPDTYIITIEGIPVDIEDHSFRMGFECCMSMSGPMEKQTPSRLG